MKDVRRGEIRTVSYSVRAPTSQLISVADGLTKNTNATSIYRDNNKQAGIFLCHTSSTVEFMQNAVSPTVYLQ